MSGNSIEKLLDRIDTGFSHFLIFAGILDNNAKLLSFRTGKASFSLPIERHETLDVQLSLMFSLIRQLEDISGQHKLTVTRFAKHDIFLFGTADLHVFIITTPTADVQVAKILADLVAMMVNNSESAPASRTTASSATGIAKDSDNNSTSSATMTSMQRHVEPSTLEEGPLSSSTSRPEIVIMLQGYLLALDTSCIIEGDNNDSSHFKIKARGADSKFTWSLLEKVSITFKDKIEMQHISTDSDGKVFVKISLK